MLRHRPYMLSDGWMDMSDRCTVDYCVFDHPYQKPTDLWHSFGGGYQPAGLTGDGQCHQKCGKGRKKANGRFQHWRRHAGPAGTGVTGSDQMIQKWQIPHNLCVEVVAELKKKAHQGDVIIDLFSGGESYRKAVEEAGFVYVPVDLKTMLRSLEQQQADEEALQQQQQH